APRGAPALVGMPFVKAFVAPFVKPFVMPFPRSEKHPMSTCPTSRERRIVLAQQANHPICADGWGCSASVGQMKPNTEQAAQV
ncbi:hypothetical protein, partial [Streptomyces sp. NPDC056480]|uniref:hypothetical protein n=1 Tax=Streptomyces sp. NPDC056480 TaxID=3345833 RepID=UPI0036A91E74